jgi:hypothetical protein
VSFNYRPNRGLMGGLLILGLGVLLLADQAGYLSASHVFRVFWPVVFMAFGLEDLLLGFNPTKRVWGAMIFAGGALFLLSNLGYLHIRLALLWPLLLIGIGVSILICKAGYGPTFFPHQGRPHRPHPWIRRGPGGPGGPFGTGGPTGPMGPGAPGGPEGFSGTSDPTQQNPPGGPPAAGAASSLQGTQDQQQPGSTTPPQNPNWGASGYSGAGPQGYGDWRSQRREFKRQMRSLKRSWRDNNWQRHNWYPQENLQQGDAQQNGPQQSGPQQNYASGVDSSESQFNYSVIFSHVERRITSKNFKSGSLSAILGGFEIDLSHADIEGDEAVIYADAFFGGGEIRIPETWLVVIEGNAIFGAFMDETRQRPPDGSAPQKKLIIRGTAVFGGVSIEN